MVSESEDVGEYQNKAVAEQRLAFNNQIKIRAFLI